MLREEKKRSTYCFDGYRPSVWEDENPLGMNGHEVEYCEHNGLNCNILRWLN